MYLRCTTCTCYIKQMEGKDGPGWGAGDAGSRRSTCFYGRSVGCLEWRLKDDLHEEEWRPIYDSFGVYCKLYIQELQGFLHRDVLWPNSDSCHTKDKRFYNMRRSNSEVFLCIHIHVCIHIHICKESQLLAKNWSWWPRNMYQFKYRHSAYMVLERRTFMFVLLNISTEFNIMFSKC